MTPRADYKIALAAWPFSGEKPLYLSGRFWIGIGVGFFGGFLLSKIT